VNDANNIDAQKGGWAVTPISEDGILDLGTYQNLQSRISRMKSAIATPTAVLTPRPPTSTSIIGSMPLGKPLWQWGLIALGVGGALYLLWKVSQEQSGHTAGYRKLLIDKEPRTSSETSSGRAGTSSDKRCPRTPSESTLEDAELLEASA
jgi:hypothetical protein